MIRFYYYRLLTEEVKQRKMLHLSLQPSSWRDHSHKEVFITTHKPASPSLRNLQTCSWIQVLMLIMSNDTSDIKGQ